MGGSLGGGGEGGSRSSGGDGRARCVTDNINRAGLKLSLDGERLASAGRRDARSRVVRDGVASDVREDGGGGGGEGDRVRAVE